MTNSREAFVESLFDGIAPVYDRMNRVMTFGLYDLWQGVLMRLAAPGEGEVALDVASGTGDLAIHLARRVGERGRVTGLDLSRGMLSVGQRKVAAQGLTDRITLVEGNALDLPFEDDTFDLAVVGFGLRNMSDVPTAIAEMRRVVRPGGRVLSLEMSHPKGVLTAPLFHLYFDHLVPYVGALGGRGRKPYEWLPASLREFPDRERLETIFSDAGLVNVFSKPLAAGSVAIHRGLVARP